MKWHHQLVVLDACSLAAFAFHVGALRMCSTRSLTDDTHVDSLSCHSWLRCSHHSDVCVALLKRGCVRVEYLLHDAAAPMPFILLPFFL
jgi:hypothetical protein